MKKAPDRKADERFVPELLHLEHFRFADSQALCDVPIGRKKALHPPEKVAPHLRADKPHR